MFAAPERLRSPGGLVLPLRASVRGVVRWMTLDERGVPEVPRNPSGFALGPAEGVMQPNLITNAGMNAIAAVRIDATNVNDSTSLRQQLAVGTGSTAPAFTDTGLVNEVQRAASVGGFAIDGNTFSYASGVSRLESLVARVVTMSADRNLAEFGLAAGSGSLNVRELFRDGGGTPVTVSLITGKSVVVKHTFIVDLPTPVAGVGGTLDIEEYDVSDTLTDTLAYTVTFGMASSTGAVAPQTWVTAWNPATVNISEPLSGTPTILKAAAVLSARSWSHTSMFTGLNQLSSQILSGSNTALAGYVADSHVRAKRNTFPAGAASGAWYGFHFGTGSASAPQAVATFGTGFTVLFGSPATYTKADTDSLRIGLACSWARA